MMKTYKFQTVNEATYKGNYQVKLSNRFAVLESLQYDADINSAWEIIKGGITISAKGV
jgi:hypothetical protein